MGFCSNGQARPQLLGWVIGVRDITIHPPHSNGLSASQLSSHVLSHFPGIHAPISQSTMSFVLHSVLFTSAALRAIQMMMVRKVVLWIRSFLAFKQPSVNDSISSSCLLHQV